MSDESDLEVIERRIQTLEALPDPSADAVADLASAYIERERTRSRILMRSLARETKGAAR